MFEDHDAPVTWRDHLIDAAQFVMDYYGWTVSMLLVLPTAWLLLHNGSEATTFTLTAATICAAIGVLGDVIGHLAVVVEFRHLNPPHENTED